MKKNKKVSRQAQYYRDNVAAGLCGYCGNAADEGYKSCTPCRNKLNTLQKEQRQKSGTVRRWVPLAPGETRQDRAKARYLEKVNKAWREADK